MSAYHSWRVFEIERWNVWIVQGKWFRNYSTVIGQINIMTFITSWDTQEVIKFFQSLNSQLFALKKEWKAVTIHQSTSSLKSTQDTSSSTMSGQFANLDHDSIELRKIKKIQSFFRGWLCRRRWKQIVGQYIKSPHAESMRKRNILVFRMVEAEEEYMEQMEVLVACFLRPFKMAASSKKPPCLHEDVNSIFLNSETVLFLHKIFLKGLTSRLESWPTLVLGEDEKILGFH